MAAKATTVCHHVCVYVICVCVYVCCAGFLSFLHLLINHPWSAAPLLVDPAGEVTPDNRRRLLAEYEGRQTAGTAPGMFIAAPYDLHSSIW